MAGPRQAVAAAKRDWPAAEVIGHRDAIARGLAADPPKACPCFDAAAWWAQRVSEAPEDDPPPTPDGEKLRIDKPLIIAAAKMTIEPIKAPPQ